MVRNVRLALVIAIAIAYAVFGLSGLEQALAQASGSIIITVKDTNGTPVPSAVVELSSTTDSDFPGRQIVTDVTGIATFGSLSDGSYAVTAGKTGYTGASDPAITVAGEQPVARDLVIAPEPPPVIEPEEPIDGAMRITVVDDQGAAVVGAGVTLYNRDGNASTGYVETDGAGVALFSGLQPGTYYAIGDAPGYEQSMTGDTVVQTGATIEAPLTLGTAPPPTTGTGNGSITVTVVINDHTAIRDAQVTLYGKTSGSVQSNELGIAMFDGIEPGGYIITVSSEFGVKSVGPVQIVDSQELELTIDLSDATQGDTGTAVIQTYTQEEYPRPLSNVEITLSGLDGNGRPTGHIAVLVTDDEGFAVFVGLPPGHYDLTALARDANNEVIGGVYTNINLYTGQITARTLHLDITGNDPELGTASLAVTVTDDQDQPVSGATVAIESSEGNVELQTDPSGSALATELPPGDVAVHASAPGYIESAPETVTLPIDTVTSMTIRLSPAPGSESDLPPDPSVQEPVPSAQSPASTVVALPSTGGGAAAPGSMVPTWLLLGFAALVALGASVRLKRG